MVAKPFSRNGLSFYYLYSYTRYKKDHFVPLSAGKSFYIVLAKSLKGSLKEPALSSSELGPRVALQNFSCFCFSLPCFVQIEMAQQSDMPKPGNRESEEKVPDTSDYDETRKGRPGGQVNTNDPQENPELLSNNAASGEKAQREESAGRRGVGQVHKYQKGRVDGDQKQFVDSTARHDNLNRKAGNESVPQRHGGRGSSEAQKRSTRSSAGSDNSFERSPHHNRISGRGTGAPSPLWEGKNSYESSYNTPGRSRLGPKGDESPDNGAAVPKFGEWDESNPAAADGYTQQFNKVREERQLGGGRLPGSLPTGSPYGNIRKQTPVDSSWGCCFFCGRKRNV